MKNFSKVFLGLLMCSQMAHAYTNSDLVGNWCYDRTAVNGEMLELEFKANGEFTEYLSVDRGDGNWSLEGSAAATKLIVDGFWVFEENLGLPQNFQDVFSVYLKDGILTLRRLENLEQAPDGSEGVYSLVKCEEFDQARTSIDGYRRILTINEFTELNTMRPPVIHNEYMEVRQSPFDESLRSYCSEEDFRIISDLYSEGKSNEAISYFLECN